jgi:hypothetical protein
MRLIIHSNQYCRRGDAVNARSLALALKKYHGVESCLLASANNKNNDWQVIESLKAGGLNVKLYNNQRELQEIANCFQATHSYFIKNGRYDGRHIKGIPNVVHAVFQHFEPHGDLYMYVSKWLYDRARTKNTIPQWVRNYPRWAKIKISTATPYFPSQRVPINWCPHIIDLPKPDPHYKIRELFNIPKNCPIIGRFGGRQEFNDPAGREAILNLLLARDDIYFLFYNTERFTDDERVIFVDNYISEAEKASVIEDCSLMLNCRLAGESFGFSVGEALFSGKPIIAPGLARNPHMDGNHIELLNDSDLLYESSEDLVEKIQKILDKPQCPNVYKEKVNQFNSQEVSNKFMSILSCV